MKNRLILSLAIFLLALGPISALAQVDISPGVGRVSLTQGDVSTQRGDSGEWSAAVVNAPVVSGDKISTGENACAEVQLDYANILRLGDHSQAIIANLTRNEIQVQVAEGIINYDVFPGNDANAEIDTPNVAIHPRHDGASFRVIVNSDDETQVIVRRGSVDLTTPQGSTTAEQGKMYTVKGTGQDTAYKSEDAPPSDDWDAWVNSRDDKIQNAKSWNDTDRYYTGSEDLDAYGQWQNSPDYGPVWVPTVGPDWAPYRAGQWDWEPYYGWTWVSYEPWGWAPYHYGRWMYYNNAWAWWPGPVVGAPYYRPVWAPAYVSFFGFGGGVGFSVGFGFGSFGWLPCGPGDFFHPWWGGYRGRFGAVNVTNIYNYHGGGWGPLRANGFSNVRLAETNEHIRGGLSTVAAGSFGAGRMNVRPVGPGMFHDAHLMTGNLPVVPSRQSLSASDRPANPSTLRNSGATHFYSKARPGSVESFQRQASQVQQSIEHDSHFTPVRSGEQQLSARNEGASSIRPTERDIPSVNSSEKSSAGVRPETNENGNVRGTNNGFTRFGSPEAQNRNQQSEQNERNPNSGSFHNNVPRPGNNQPQGSRPEASDQNGWHRFSESGSPNGQSRSKVSGQRNVPRPPNSSSPYSNRSTSGPNNSFPRPSQSPANSRGNSGGDYRPFSSSPRSSAPQPSNRSFGGNAESRGAGSYRSYSPEPSNRGFGGSADPRGYSPRSAIPNYGSNRNYGAESARSYSRPPLDMRQPIVGGRSSGGFGAGGYHGGGGGPSFHSSGGGSHGGGGGGRSGGGGGHRR